MKVCLIWTAPDPLINITVRYERYVRGLRRLGHEAITVCLPEAAVGYDEPVATAPDAEALRNPDFWAALRPDAVFVITWLGLPDVVIAVKAACPWVVSIADSDGKVGVRVHPRPTFDRMVAQHKTLGMKARAIKYWLKLYFAGSAELDQSSLESASYADRIAVCSASAVEHLRAFFDAYHRPDLSAKVVSVPYPVDACYLAGAVTAVRADKIVGIGRWDDPQKDAGLLCAALTRHFAAGWRTEIVLFGANGEQWFGPLAKRWPQVRYLGVCAPEVIARHLGESRALLLPSRWESGPIVLNEALASGCTVVGTDSIPSVVSVCSEGGFGMVSAGRSPAAFAKALGDEMAAWDRGDRDAEKIANYWRPRFEPAAVCQLLLPPN